MRSTSVQVKAFIKAVSHFVIKGECVELRLHGSRVDDALKGGDIDLLLVTHSEAQRQNLSFKKAEILAKIFMTVDEERIDITVCDVTSSALDPFVKKIIATSVLLHQWS